MSALPLDRIDGEVDVARLGVEVREQVASEGLAIASNFVTDADRFMALCNALGDPLVYGDGLIGGFPGHPAIHHVKYERKAAQRGELHALQGALGLHSAQSMRDPRPKYFVMLMVDAGWQGMPFGSNGESMLVAWESAFKHMRNVNPDATDAFVAAFREPVVYPDGVARPLVYDLTAPKSFDDLGVRMKYDITEGLMATDPGRGELLLQFQAAAVAASVSLQLRSGDLLVLDNDRWAHGRHQVLGERTGQGGMVEFNPRELWSVTVG